MGTRKAAHPADACRQARHAEIMMPNALLHRLPKERKQTARPEGSSASRSSYRRYFDDSMAPHHYEQLFPPG